MSRYDYRTKEAAEYRKWYSLAAWRGPNGRRAHQLQAEPLCRFCEQRGRVTPASVADHIVPHRGNDEAFWHGALQSLCADCHDIEKQQIENRGYSMRADADGYPVDPMHPANKART